MARTDVLLRLSRADLAVKPQPKVLLTSNQGGRGSSEGGNTYYDERPDGIWSREDGHGLPPASSGPSHREYREPADDRRTRPASRQSNDTSGQYSR